MRRQKAPSDRKERGSPWANRRHVLIGCFLLAGVLIVGRAAKLQVLEHDRWVRAAEEQHRERVELPARRGEIFDRNGVPLALSREMYQVSVAPTEIDDVAAAVRSLATGLGISAREAERAVSRRERWVVLPGRYSVEQRQKVGQIAGVYFERRFDRVYPQGDAGREVVGALTRDDRALGGIEQQLDEVLRGEAGYSVFRRDAKGRTQAALSLPVVPPSDGASVYLTIDFDLQQIADAALLAAMDSTGAAGGDLVLSDPRTGEILAAVSRRGGRTRSLTAITEPYEPGSTLKPFLAATLLARHRASMRDSVNAENGVWTEGGRTFKDTSPHGWLSLRDALRVSSNIALVKFAKRLSPGEQYSYLRDFGFGTPTGIEYPAESTGRLHRPEEWSKMSSASLAMGYELSATPLQVVAAYGALANGGRLMEPYLVREVRAPDGRILGKREPTRIRQVVPAEVAEAVTEVLVAVVEDGTATRASLATFTVAGKTGTSRRSVGGGYESGAYTSTFAGYFPADDPQIVIFVKLDEPQGDYYGGLTAAPVTREMLQGILAARNPALSPRTLLASRTELVTVARSAESVDREPSLGAGGRYVFLLGDDLPVADPVASPRPIAVPDLAGLSMREATRRAHASGLRARVSGSGDVLRTEPAAGGTVVRGQVVTLVGGALR